MWKLVHEVFGDGRELGIFFLVTVALGGGTAWATGRAIAATWRPWWHTIGYMLILGAVVRFFHFALFEGPLLWAQGYVLDTAVCILFGLFGFRTRRVTQMVADYGWINERAGLMGWRRRPSLDNTPETR
ncbi:MAG: DUF6867 family protein [Xanthobacteraceae bacterium]